MKEKYFTIVIRADDESVARKLIPGEMIGPNKIVACSLGDALSLNEQLRQLVADDKDEEAAAAELENFSAFIN